MAIKDIPVRDETERSDRPVLDGTYQGKFIGYEERKRATFETRNDPVPDFEDVYVFKFEVLMDEGTTEISKWIRVPAALSQPSNGKMSNLYKMLCWLSGQPALEDADLLRAEDLVTQAVGVWYEITVEPKASGWNEIIKAKPLRKSGSKPAPARPARRFENDDETPF